MIAAAKLIATDAVPKVSIWFTLLNWLGVYGTLDSVTPLASSAKLLIYGKVAMQERALLIYC